jgi:pentatricopeptide repeat protein
MGTLHCWQTLENVRNIEFPEGLCLTVLSVAAAHGHPALAASVFDQLAKLKVTWHERHFLPLIEAYLRAGDLRQAFIVISIMRESCATPPHRRIMLPLLGEISKSTKSLDRAYFLLQDIKQKEGKKVDIVAFNALIEACIKLTDTSRALSTYQEAEKFGVTPNIDTYNLLLRSVQKVAHMDLMMVILKDMKAAGIAPNENTFVFVILTCILQSPPDYEPAFAYLEEMKASGMLCPAGVYVAFIKKCTFANDDRAYGLLDEMKKAQYGTEAIERWMQKTVTELGDGRVNVFKQHQQQRIERMSGAREEEREATRGLVSSLSRRNQADIEEEYLETERIEKVKEDGLLA